MSSFDTTEIYDKNLWAYNQGYKIIVNQGGTSSSKTYSLIQLFIFLAVASPGISSIVSESLPHLKRGAIRDFVNIMGDDYNDNLFNKTDHIYSFGSSKLEFFSADDSKRLRGGRRKRLFLNEVNNITELSFNELDVRTEECTFVDFNPVSDFWVHQLLAKYGITDFTKDCFPAQKDICFIHSTYLHAKHLLPKSTVEKIESRRERDPNWWNVYGLGLVGNIEGLIHPVFTTTKDMPQPGVGIEFYGLDFGFTDETALIKCVVVNDQLFCDQLIYETGLTNPQIARRMESLGVRKNHDEIFADSAEPKSIKEIASYGFNIKPVEKGPDSVRAGILKVNEYKQIWTERSVDAIKEQRNYRYIQKDDGTFSEKPIEDFDHAMSARRYAVISKGLQVIDRIKLLIHIDKIVERNAKLEGHYEVLNGFTIKESKMYVVTCQWDCVDGRLHVNYEASMDTLDDIEAYVKSVKKPHNVGHPNLDSDAVKNIVNELMKKAVYIEVDDIFDPLSSMYFLNQLIDNKKLTINSCCRGLLLGMQNDVEIKELSPHLEALLYVINNIYVQVKEEDRRKPLKPFTKEKYKYQQEQQRILIDKEYKDKEYAPGWE